MPVVFRPISLEALAGSAAEHDVEILDLRLSPPSALEGRLAALRPRVVGVTCPYTLLTDTVRDTCAAVRRLAPDALLLVGGAHPSLNPGDFLGCGADIVVRGAGEEVFREILDTVQRGEDPRSSSGLYLLGDTVTATPPRPLRGRGFSLRFRYAVDPARAADFYTPDADGSQHVTVSTRGCPHHCTFCAAWQIQGGRYQRRPAGEVLEEITGRPEQVIYFFDDNSFDDIRASRALVEAVEKAGIRRRYKAWCRADTIVRHPDIIRRWRDAGLARVSCGLEGHSDDVLRMVQKGTEVSRNERAMETLAVLGIDLIPSFVVTTDFGDEDFDALARYVERRGLRETMFFILTPLPGTLWFEEVRGRVITRNPAHYDLHHPVLPTTRLPPREFVRRFVSLFLDSAAWRAAGQRSPFLGEYLDKLRRLPDEYPAA